MKSILTVILVVVSVVLAGALFLTKQSNNAQMASDAASIGDYSNRLDTTPAQLTSRAGTMVTLSNRLDECQSAFGEISNRETEAQATVTQSAEQITNLTHQVASAIAENQSLNQQVMNLTNQMAGLAQQLALTQTSLTQTNKDLVQLQKDYALLDNRFRRDVAERVVVERKFNTYSEVEAQLKKLWSHSVPWTTPESIYKGLNVEIASNGVAHVIMPE